ncbi:MAG: M43 family zinc metalloprotease [Saprospiraceae bacterium]
MRTIKNHTNLIYVIGFFFLFFNQNLIAQSPQHECGYDDFHKNNLQKRKEYLDGTKRSNEDAYQKIMSLSKKSTKNSNSPQNKISTIYTIPVVVHVMHLGESVGTGSNISDAQVNSAIEHLNDAFRNINDYAGGPFFSNAGISSSDVEIEFCLAIRDPNGASTSGINRINTSYSDLDRDDPCSPVSGSDTQDDCMKALSFWDSNDYLNIWTVNEICTGAGVGCGVAGYAYTAGAHGQIYDGVVNEAGYFGSSPDDSKVHIHEVGHYLNLYHTFDDECNETDCLTGGDLVCDTPPDNGTTGINCFTSGTVNTCSNDATITNSPFVSDVQDMYENYMDYGFLQCQNTFTPDQTTRMRSALTGTRASLLSSQGCVTPAVPVSNFNASSTSECEGSIISFTDVSTNGTTSWSWTFPGGTPSSSTDQNPTITYATEGNYDVTLVASNSVGNGSTETKTEHITIYNEPTTTCNISATNANTSGSNFGIGIYNVTLGSINNSSLGTVSEGVIYKDNTCSDIIELDPSTSYSLSVTPGSANFENIKAYIDFNDNGDFTDSGEEIFSATAVKVQTTQSFTTSATPTMDKLLTMRVVSDFANFSVSSCVTPTNGQVEDYGIFFASPVLPIELISFYAAQKNETVLLNWQTATEQDNDYFTLEHSSDGITFDFLEKIDGGGNSFSINNYRYVHINPKQGNNYYRLSQTDFDGTTKVAGIKVANFRTENKVASIFPNPIQEGILNLKYPSPIEDNLAIQVFDVSGKILIERNIEINEGNNQIELPIQKLGNGIYWLRTSQGDRFETIRFIKME